MSIEKEVTAFCNMCKSWEKFKYNEERSISEKMKLYNCQNPKCNALREYESLEIKGE